MNKIQTFIGLGEIIDLTLNRYNKRFGNLITFTNSFQKNHINYYEVTPALNRSESLLLSKFQTEQAELLAFLEQNSI